ncbi:hypothetical protein BGX29_011526 [Mortierella sp. GBA35]|nr:hypothetical protein BGX29_011526 [Mortierella sp. GBA35]
MEALNKKVSKVVLLLIDGDWNGGGDESGGESGREGDQDRDEDGVHDEGGMRMGDHHDHGRRRIHHDHPERTAKKLPMLKWQEESFLIGLTWVHTSALPISSPAFRSTAPGAKPSFPPSGDPSTTLPTLSPILSESVAGFGGTQGGDADAIAAAVPVVGGFNAAPVAVGFGATPVAVGTVPVTIQETAPEPDIEYSEALFPDHLIMADYTQLEYSRFCNESIQARAIHDWVFSQHLWHLIRINPGLVRLDITRNCLPVFVSIPGEFYYATITSLKKLRELKIFSPSIELEFWRLLELLPPGIESLSIGYELFPLPDPLPEINPNLRSLSARGNTTIAGLHELLGIFPNLKTLELDCIANDSGSTGHQLPPPPFEGHSLRRLQTVAHDWDTLLRYFPSIVVWETEEMLNEEVTLYLRERMPQIESFRTTHQPQYIDESRPESDPANQFLVTNRHLKEFDSIQHHLWVDDMLRQPWACMGLEWLTCRIVGVDRLFPEEEDIVTRVMATGYSVELSAEESGAVEKFNRCRAQHHGVYDRLASLTRLKHLDFGYENRYTWTSKSEEYYIAEDGEEYLEYNGPVFDTLELTLESGLGRLAALRDLEMFGFECVNHRIGRAELDWMAKSWPKLKLMYGLDRERLYIEPSKERAALKKYFLELRPDVVHDSLFVDNV